MGIKVRPLYAPVSLLRPDLASQEATIGFAIREAFRRLTIDAPIARELVTQQVTSGQNGIAVALTTGRNLIKIHRVQIKATTETSYTDVPMVGWDLLTGDPITNGTPARPNTGSQYQEALYLYPVADATYDLKIDASWTPDPAHDLDDLGIPFTCAPALQALATSILCRVPGPNQDIAAAEREEAKYMRSLSAIRLRSVFGDTSDSILVADRVPGVR